MNSVRSNNLSLDIKGLNIQRPNLKNLSSGLNLSRGLIKVGFTLNCIKCFKIYAGAQFKPGFGGFKPRLKFFNSASGRIDKGIRKVGFLTKT